MHVAILDEELPYPLNSGKRIRTFQLVSRLAPRHRITYICHRNADPREAVEAEAVFRDLGIEPIVVQRAVPPRSGLRFHARLAANLFSPLPYSVASHTSRALGRAIRDLRSRRRVDLWQAEWTPYVHSLRSLEDARLLIMAHNVESQIWWRYYENEADPLRRWYIGRQWRKYRRFECAVFRRADRVVAVSPGDADRIYRDFGAKEVAVVDNGVDTSFFRPDSSRRIPGRILFLGSLDWRPNLDAVERLLGAIFPAVRAQAPAATLCLVGRNPPESLRSRAAATAGVELHANVLDVRPFLAEASVMVVPLRIGGGSRLKILEALAAGTPVVSTRIGAEGLEVRDGEHLVVVERCEDMARAILHLGRNESAIQRMICAGRRLVEERYGWDILADRLDGILGSLVKEFCTPAVRSEPDRSQTTGHQSNRFEQK
ncbi:MAG: glycosyltransferase [Isosphaeraceae bacterium]